MYLNGEKVDKLPQDAIEKMCKNISRVVSEYFAQHPEEFDEWMESMGAQALPDVKKPTSLPAENDRARV